MLPLLETITLQAIRMQIMMWHWMLSVSRWEGHLPEQQDWLCVQMDMRQNLEKD